MQADVTKLLTQVTAGDSDAAAQMFPQVYENLRALASSFFRNQPANSTLQPTALVHEVFLKMVDQTRVQSADRAHFFAIAATAMRQVLADHARRRRAIKRGGGAAAGELADVAAGESSSPLDLLALDDAIRKLSELEPRQARIVELRFFGGLTHEEIARVLDLSTRMIEKEWRRIRAWLAMEMDGRASQVDEVGGES